MFNAQFYTESSYRQVRGHFYFLLYSRLLLDLHLVLSAFSLLNFFLYVTVNQTSVDMFSPTEKRIKYVQITIEKGM